MVKPGPTDKAKDLLGMWDGKHVRFVEELSFLSIVNKAKQKLNIKRRTVINYLNELVGNEILEKRVDKDRKTFYKPANKMEVMKAVLKQLIDGSKDYFLVETLYILGVQIMIESTHLQDPDEIVDTAIEKFIQKRNAMKVIKNLRG